MKSEELRAFEADLDARQGRYWRADPYDDAYGIRAGEDLNRWLTLRDESAMAEAEGEAEGEGNEPDPFDYAGWTEAHRALPVDARAAHWNSLGAERPEDFEAIEEQLRKGYALDRPADLLLEDIPVPKGFDVNVAFNKSEWLLKLVEGGDADMEPVTWGRVQQLRALAGQLPPGHPERDQAIHTVLTLLTAATAHLFNRPGRVTTRTSTQDRFGNVTTRETDSRGRLVSEAVTTAEELAALRVDAEVAAEPWRGLAHISPEEVVGWGMDTRLRFMNEHPDAWEALLRGETARLGPWGGSPVRP